MLNDNPADLSSPLTGQARSSNDEHEQWSTLDAGRPPIHDGVTEQSQLSPHVSSVVPTPESLWTSSTLERDEELLPEHQTIDTYSQLPRRHSEAARESLLEGQQNVTPYLLASVSGHESVVTTNRPNISSTPPSVKSRARGKRSSAHRYWAWEISASILSIACIASIVGVLLHEQNKPLRQWGFGQMQFAPNVVVSLLGTLGKSACLVAVAEIVSQLKWMHYQNNPQKLSDLQLFDDASRGPWGALQLAIRKNLKTLLATCASIITIACLLIDPFIQSVFKFPSVLTPVQGQFPTILSSQTYGLLSNQSTDACLGQNIRTSLQAAVLRPIYNAQREPSLPCNFERCEWPTITTLGVCSNCMDLTDTITSICNFTVTSWNYRVQMYQRKIQCSYTLPETKGQSEGATPVHAVFKSEMELDGATPYLANTSTLWNSSAVQPWDTRMKTTNYSTIMNNFTFIQFDPVTDLGKYVPGGWETLHNVTGFTGPPVKKAGTCTMQLCAKTFENPYYGNFTASNLTGSQEGLVQSSVDWIQSEEIILLKLESESGISIPKEDTTFRIKWCDWMTLPDFLYALFSVSIDSLESSENGGDRAGLLAGLIPNIGAAISKVDDVAALVSQVADSLTEEFRTSADSFPTNGVGMNSEVFIVIDWAWLALPISVTVLTFALLLVVIITNHVRGMPPWRSSNLALLFHEVDGWDSSQMVVSGPEDMKARAKEMKAQVTYEEDLLLFSKAK